MSVGMQRPGSLALVGSGEYTPAMVATDQLLLASRMTGSRPAQVVVIPTASGLEPGMPAEWNKRGVRHFQALGTEVRPLQLITRADAQRPDILAALEGADLFYFSGGSPEYAIETLRATPAWELILAQYRMGAVLAGCSAGAMLLGATTLQIRALAQGQPPHWIPALGVAPDLAVLPHFDRLTGFVSERTFQHILTSAPAGIQLVGIDEDTALIREIAPNGGVRWHVMGRQTVVVFDHSRRRRVYHPGESVPL